MGERMHVFKRLAVAAAAAGMLLGALAGTASASTAAPARASAAVGLTGGQTSVTTAPGLAGVLLKHDIVPIATLPGTEGAGSGAGGVYVRFTFPVTGGKVNLAKLTGTIDHSGGILFLDPVTGKEIAVGDFTINVGQRDLTAIVNGNPKERVPLLSLGLGGAKITASKHAVRISGIVVRLTATAAGALDATFGTTLFTAGLELGTASTLIRF
jgi:hypothetical protein